MFDGWRCRSGIQCFVLLPGGADDVSEFFKVSAVERFERVQRVLFHVLQQCQVSRVVEEHSADNFREDVFRGASVARVVEQVTGSELGCGEERVGQPARHGVLVEAGGGLEEFDATQDTAVLVLPSSACREELFQNECAVANRALVPAQTAEVAQRSQHGGGENTARSESRAGGDGGEECDFHAAAKVLQLFLQGVIAFFCKSGEEAGECQCCFGDGEGRAHLVVGAQLFVGFNDLHGSQVDGTANDERFFAGFDIDLQRLLPVEFDGEVHDVTARVERVGRCVGPASREVDADGAASPDNLVGENGGARGTSFVQHVFRESFSQQAESLCFVTCGVFGIGVAQCFCPEHGVADFHHECGVFGQRFGEFPSFFGIAFRHVFEVDLIEHASPPVFGNHRNRFRLHFSALCHEAMEIGLFRESCCRESRQAAPKCGGLSIRSFADEPVQQFFETFHVGGHGEEAGILQVLRVAQFFLVDSSSLQPFGERLRKIEGGIVVSRSSESIVKAVGAQGKVFFADRHHVDADARFQTDVPVVAGNAREDVVEGILPSLSDKGVLHPDVAALCRRAVFEHTVLREDGTLRFDSSSEDVALVFHQVLNSHGGLNHVAVRAEVVEFTAGQREHGDAQVAQCGVRRGRIQSETATKFGV